MQRGLGAFVRASRPAACAVRWTSGNACGPAGHGGSIVTALTLALVDYWTALPSRSKSARLRGVEELRRRVESGALEPSALVPSALGDPDEDVVFGATSAWLSAQSDAVTAACDATEWVRRGLAINRGAVFAALLARGDEAVNSHLRRLRLGLSADEVATVCRHASRRHCEWTQAFLCEWHELLDGEATAPARACLAASLAERARVA